MSLQALLLFTLSLAQAKLPVVQPITDPALGTMTVSVRMTKSAEPAIAPYRTSISVKCKTHSQPKVLAADLVTCKFVSRIYNQTKKILTILYKEPPRDGKGGTAAPKCVDASVSYSISSACAIP